MAMKGSTKTILIVGGIGAGYLAISKISDKPLIGLGGDGLKFPDLSGLFSGFEFPDLSGLLDKPSEIIKTITEAVREPVKAVVTLAEDTKDKTVGNLIVLTRSQFSIIRDWRRLKKLYIRIESKISAYEQRIADSGLDSNIFK